MFSFRDSHLLRLLSKQSKGIIELRQLWLLLVKTFPTPENKPFIFTLHLPST